MKLSPHFNSKEFECHCGQCGMITMNQLLIMELEAIRYIVNEPIYINSGYRCKSYNHKVGGVKNSQHVLGNAADIRCKSLSAVELGDILLKMYPNQYGIGIYTRNEDEDKHFVHFDVRDYKARWLG